MKARNWNDIALLKAHLAEKAAQIKALRTELHRTSCLRTRANIAGRIDHKLTPKVRRMHLAYAFLRGIDYKDVERTAHQPPKWDEVKEIVDKYGVRENWDLPGVHARSLIENGRQERDERWKFWLAEAKAHYESNRIS